MAKLKLTSVDCKIQNTWSQSNKKRKGGTSGIPIILHSSSRVCWEATDWLTDLWKWGRSLTTLKSYAGLIVLFITFLDNEKIPLDEVDDDTIILFRDYLLEKKQSNNQVNRALRRVIYMYLWLQHNGYFKHKVIGVNTSDAQFNVVSNSYTYKSRNGISGSKEYFTHISILPPDIREDRRAVPDHLIDRLWEQLPNFKTKFREARDEVMLLLLENTGGRRVEINDITVDNIRNAAKTGKILLRTLKHENEYEERLFPISTEVINTIINYIECEREEIIISKIKSKHIKEDCKTVLISNRGKPWAPQSISDEIIILKKMAGIKEKIHPHLFRHRCVTILLDQIKQDLNKYGESVLAEVVIHKVMALFGWKSREMVTKYNDIHLEESEGFHTSETNFTARLSSNSGQRQLHKLVSALNNLSPKNKDVEEKAQSILDQILGVLSTP